MTANKAPRKSATSFDTYEEYVAARRAGGHCVVSERLWFELKAGEV